MPGEPVETTSLTGGRVKLRQDGAWYVDADRQAIVFWATAAPKPVELLNHQFGMPPSALGRSTALFQRPAAARAALGHMRDETKTTLSAHDSRAALIGGGHGARGDHTAAQSRKEAKVTLARTM